MLILWREQGSSISWNFILCRRLQRINQLHPRERGWTPSLVLPLIGTILFPNLFPSVCRYLRNKAYFMSISLKWSKKRNTEASDIWSGQKCSQIVLNFTLFFWTSYHFKVHIYSFGRLPSTMSLQWRIVLWEENPEDVRMCL